MFRKHEHVAACGFLPSDTLPPQHLPPLESLELGHVCSHSKVEDALFRSVAINMLSTCQMSVRQEFSIGISFGIVMAPTDEQREQGRFLKNTVVSFGSRVLHLKVAIGPRIDCRVAEWVNQCNAFLAFSLSCLLFCRLGIEVQQQRGDAAELQYGPTLSGTCTGGSAASHISQGVLDLRRKAMIAEGKPIDHAGLGVCLAGCVWTCKGKPMQSDLWWKCLSRKRACK